MKYIWKAKGVGWENSGVANEGERVFPFSSPFAPDIVQLKLIISVLEGQVVFCKRSIYFGFVLGGGNMLDWRRGDWW